MGDQVDFELMSDAELEVKLLIGLKQEARNRNELPEAAGLHLQNAWISVSGSLDTHNIQRKISLVGALKTCMSLVDQDFAETIVNDHISKRLTEQKLWPEVNSNISALNDALWDFVVEYITYIPSESKLNKSLNVVKVIVQECFKHWNETDYTKEFVFQSFFKEFSSKLYSKETFCGRTYCQRVNHVYEYLLKSVEDKFGISAMYSYYWHLKLLLMSRTFIPGRFVLNKEVLIRFGSELGIFVNQLKEKNHYYNSFLGKNVEKILKITAILSDICVKGPIISLRERHVKILIAYGLTRHETLETLVLALNIMPEDLENCGRVETELQEVLNTIKKQNSSELTAFLRDKFSYLQVQNILLGDDWQKQALENLEDSVNDLSISPMPCLKIRNMVDKKDNKYSLASLRTVVTNVILDKCGSKCKVLQVDVDRASRCVYVKCASAADAGVAFRALHGWLYSGRNLDVQYLSLEHYMQRFPDSPAAGPVLTISAGADFENR